MKKLMIAAAAAAMIGGVEAATVPANGEQVYDMTITLKTTKGVRANLKAKSNTCIDFDHAAYVRKQTTVKIGGKIWGCGCEEIADGDLIFTDWYTKGARFWNVTGKYTYDSDETKMEWYVLDRIDTTAKKLEAGWNLYLALLDDEETSVLEYTLQGAGFGTASDYDEIQEPNNRTYIPSVSGYCVGTRYYTCATDDTELGTICNPYEEVTPISLEYWKLCDCTDGDADTIAYGSWSLKFNSTQAKKFAKLEQGSNIYPVLGLPKYVY